MSSLVQQLLDRQDISTMPADALVPDGTRASAGIADVTPISATDNLPLMGSAAVWYTTDSTMGENIKLSASGRLNPLSFDEKFWAFNSLLSLWFCDSYHPCSESILGLWMVYF